MAGRFTFPVAVMQPAPPARKLSSRKTSEPENTAKPGKESISVRVLLQSPELSLRPTTTPGYASMRRPARSGEKPTPAIGGMW